MTQESDHFDETREAMPETVPTQASTDQRSDPTAPTQIDSVTDEEVTLLAAPTGLIGTTLDDRYYVEKELGQGGIGAVYLARDRKLVDKRVVVKILLEKSLQSEWVMRKFQHEKEALALVDHPGIVGVLDDGVLPNGMPYLVMQYIDGSDLRSYVRPEGADLEWTASVVEQIGLALQAAHDKGVLHRDLKPENVMIQTVTGGRPHVKVIDFGIAKVTDPKLAPSTAKTIAPGTVPYMSPEQLRGQKLNPASDIYALGLIAYELVTGRRPFNPETVYQLPEMQRLGVKVNPQDLRPALPEAAQKVILRALAHDPAARQQSAAGFAFDFARGMNDDAPRPLVDPQAETKPIPPVRETDGPVPPPSPDPKSHAVRLHPAVIVAAILLITALGGFFAWRNWGTGKPPAGGPDGTRSPTPISAGPEQSLSYWLTVQKMRDGKPYQQPYESTGDEGLETDYGFNVNVLSPQSGYLYLLNEGSAGSAITYNVLYPKPDVNSGSAALEANKTFQTPDPPRAYVLDPNTGVENFWIIWSAKPVPELEAVKGVITKRADGTFDGTVKDMGQASAIWQFLAKYDAVSKTVTPDANRRRATVKGNGDVLVYRLSLKHN